MKLIGIDPGFASCGIVVWEDGVFTNGTVLRTKKDGKKKASDDNLDRTRELGQCMGAWFEGARAVVAEAMSYPRHASVAHKMGLVWGAVVTATTVPVFQLSPQEVRRLLELPKGATKVLIQSVLSNKYPELRELQPPQKTLREHHYDAAAALEAWLRSDQGRFLVGG
jgi:hypothetical protein